MTTPIRSIGISRSAFALTLLALVVVLKFRLLAPLLAGLLVYELIHLLTPVVQRYIPNKRSKLMAVALLAFLIVAILSGGVIATIVFFRSDAGSSAALIQKLSRILEDARSALPAALVSYLPANGVDLREEIIGWLRSHAAELQTIGKETAIVLAQTLIAMVAGALLSMHEAVEDVKLGPLGVALVERAHRLADAFHRIVFSQIRISAVNTAFSAIYLAIVLPVLGVHLPLTKTMIGITFFAGLLPVIGNLISNTVIVVISLAHSPQVAFGSLAFLVVIHKLEYFLNARIVGSQINARAWELLLAMLTMEAVFGVAGLVAAPIYYAFLKSELVKARLV